MTDETPIDETTPGLDRRSLIKRGAIVGGALVWTTPVVQAIASPAFGADTSPDGGEQGVCVAGTKYYVKFNEGSDDPDFGYGNATSNCTGVSPATTSLLDETIADQITVVYSPDKITATISIPAGYVLDTTLSGGKAGNSANSCNVTITLNGDGTYTATSTATFVNGGGNTVTNGISHVELVLVCA